LTNFHDNLVEVYDTNFKFVNSFTDKRLPRGFAPFGIQNVGGVLIVTFAKQKAPDNVDDQAGRGLGVVDAFDPSGRLLARLAAHGTLNAPWGVAVAPSTFGRFGGDLLIGDFGDGRINAYRVAIGRHGGARARFDGQLLDASGKPLVIDGLWGLKFGDGGMSGDPNTLFFSSGPNDESHGLFGTVTPASTS
jgi:uncharacterized protein (TIGR03118 family)